MMSGKACLRCGSPATKIYTLYDPRTDVHQDVPLCEACYSSYTPVLKKGKLVWKRSGLVTYYPPFFFAIGSRRAAEAASRLLDRLVRIQTLPHARKGNSLHPYSPLNLQLQLPDL
jgi:hypothetical protein